MYQIIKNLDHQAKNIQWLEFELSNNCQCKKEHEWCPASRDNRELIFLKSSIVHKVIQFFKRYDFSGRVYFSGYSEPLIDARLVDLVKYVKRHLPKCNIDMFTNGIACDENLLTDLLEAGVDQIRLSIYNQSERERLKRIKAKVKLKGVFLQDRRIGLCRNDIDNRINVYNLEGKGLKEPCYMPTLYYFVRNNGDVTMCFWDWKYTQIFGNLYKDSVEDTLLDSNRLRINYELVNNNRAAIPVCSGCGLPAERCIREYKSRMRLE